MSFSDTQCFFRHSSSCGDFKGKSLPSLKDYWGKHCALPLPYPYPTLPYPTLPYPTLPLPLPYPTLPYPTPTPTPTLTSPTIPYPTLPYPINLASLPFKSFFLLYTQYHFSRFSPAVHPRKKSLVIIDLCQRRPSLRKCSKAF